MSKLTDYAKEVFAIEAKAVQNLSNLLTEDFDKAIEAILKCTGKVIVCGMGKSGIVGKKIAATMASTGTPSFYVHPGEAFHGDLGMLTKEDILIAISNSGETEEMIKLIPSFKDNGNVIISLTSNPKSTLATNSNFHLNIAVEEEACPLQLAPTSSTTATMAMGDAIAVTLMNERNFKPENFAKFHPGGSLGRRLLTKVKHCMRSENLPIVKENDLFRDVIEVMTSGRLGMAIVEFDDKSIGVITDGDLRRAMRSFDCFIDLKASEFCTKNPKIISPEAKLNEAEELMGKHKITTLLVGNSYENIEGIIQIYNL